MELLAATGDSPCETGFNSCSLLWRMTESRDFSLDGGAVIDTIVKILLIVIVAFVLRWLVNRFIARIIQQVTNAKRPQSIAELNSLLGSTKTRREEIVGDRRLQRAATLTSVLQHINGVVIFSVAFMMILGAFNVNLAPILASAGIAGLAIGFGAQHLVQDYVAGIFMLLEDQYGVGDIVDVGEVVGTVEDMGLRVTTIRSLDGTLWYVRNGQILRVGNTSQSWAYIVLDIPLPPAVDVDEASEVIMGAVRSFAEDEEWSESVLGEPEFSGVASMTIDETTVRFGLKMTSDQQWAGGRELRRRISEALKDAGVSMTGGRIYVPRGGSGPAAQ
ncbi:MAG TPA: mechanosensitive ion channel family protein [Glycomyces sp.]|nr:mechanosensitive ion channel family protein [Glycomyces sp.]